MVNYNFRGRGDRERIFFIFLLPHITENIMTPAVIFFLLIFANSVIFCPKISWGNSPNHPPILCAYLSRSRSTAALPPMCRLIIPILIRAKRRNQLKTALIMASLSLVTSPYMLFLSISSIHAYSTSDQWVRFCQKILWHNLFRLVMCSNFDVYPMLSTYVKIKIATTIPTMFCLYIAIWFRLKFTGFFGSVNQRNIFI